MFAIVVFRVLLKAKTSGFAGGLLLRRYSIQNGSDARVLHNGQSVSLREDKILISPTLFFLK